MHVVTANECAHSLITYLNAVKCLKYVAKIFHSFLLFFDFSLESPKWILLKFRTQKNFISDHFKQKPYFFSNGSHRSIKDHFIYNSDTIQIINCAPYVLLFANCFQNQALTQVTEKFQEKEIAETSTRLEELSKSLKN